jgi:DNA polymerase III delta subunit
LDIWDGVNSDPLDQNRNRLILVREAQKVRNWNPLANFMANLRLLPTTYLLFVSSEPDFNYEVKRAKDTPSQLAGHLETIKGKGSLVRAVYPSEEDTVAWLQRYLPGVGAGVVTHILIRSGGDLGIARNVARKASVFRGRLSTEIVDVLVSDRSSDGFVDALLAQDKSSAFRALKLLPERDYLKTIGLLDSRLETLTKLFIGVRAGQGIKELAMAGVPAFLARALMPLAKIYDPQRVAACRSVLAVVDQEIRRGARGGTMESLVALW